MSAARREYEGRYLSAQTETARLTLQDRVLANQRLVVFVVGIALGWSAWGANLLSGWFILAPLTAFAALAVVHDRVIKQLELARRRTAFHEQGIARLDGRWAGSGNPGTRYSDSGHPYAVDLDLFGRGSLFELLCVARTRAGEETLAAWLLDPASPDVIRSRQEALRDLAPRLDLREQIALMGDEVRSGVDPGALSAWGAEPARPFPRSVRATALVLGVLSTCALTAWFAGYGPMALIIMAAAGRAFEIPYRNRVKSIVQAVAKPARDLELLRLLLARLELEPFESPLLLDLTASLALHSESPSRRIARLQTLVDYLRSRENMLFTPFAALVVWSSQFAFAIESWRAENGPQIATWLRVIGEFEALSSMALHTFEHPDDVFPEIVDGPVCLEAEGLAHPLLSEKTAVPNDLALGTAAHALIVSGSNMSGKSTLLRTLGVNVVLALAGAPVRARQFRLSPVSLGASIRTQDSLQGGVSRFYAEITRLRQIMELAENRPPALFLLDEILHGTNSHDRLVGAEAVVQALMAKGAIGLVTTHDLALARIAEDPSLAVVNVHFQDEIRDGKMSFDYRLRLGVVEKSNAIELMRSVGLPV